MSDSIEPLLSSVWFQRIRKVADGHLGSTENALRHASHLLQLTPSRFREVVRLTIEEEEFERLLAAGDYDTAARYLIAQPTALTVVEQDCGHSIRATISCVILNRAIHGSGPTVADALLSAWTNCLLALEASERKDQRSRSN
jgi:hypothetical protein